MNRYDGRVALVVGGAQGIGAAAATAFGREGGVVVVADIDPAGEDVAARIRDGGGKAHFVATDATDEAQVAALADRILTDFGALHSACNLTGNIGALDRSNTEMLDGDRAGWDQTLALCATSAFLCTRHQIRVMLETGGGAIANTASLAAIRINDHASPAYHAAKAGVIHLSRMAAVTYGGRGIRVNIVAPGLTATPRIVAAWDEDERARMATVQPIGRMVTPEEVAEAYLWLCSSQASGVNGVTIPVDGGAAAR